MRPAETTTGLALVIFSHSATCVAAFSALATDTVGVAQLEVKVAWPGGDTSTLLEDRRATADN